MTHLSYSRAPLASGRAFAIAPSTPVSEGQHFNFDAGGPTLLIAWARPTPQEVSDVRRGLCEFALVTFGPILVLLAKFGNQYWLEAPYSIQMLPRSQMALPIGFRSGLRYGLTVTLFDTCTAVPCGGRYVTFSPEFSDRLHEEVRPQLSFPITRAEYDTAVNALFTRYRTAESMLPDACARTAGGV